MGMDSYHHGVRVFELDDGTRPLRTVETSIVGLKHRSSGLLQLQTMPTPIFSRLTALFY